MRRVDPLPFNVAIATKEGTPTQFFMRVWDASFNTANAVGGLFDVELLAGLGLTGGGRLGDLADITFAIDPAAIAALFDNGSNITFAESGGLITADLTDTGVTPGEYGDASNIPVITVDDKGRVTDLSTVPATGGGGGGDLSAPLVTGESPVVLIDDTLGQTITVPLNNGAQSRIVAYLGYGDATDRPTTPAVPTGATALYFATDTNVKSFWNGSAWVNI